MGYAPKKATLVRGTLEAWKSISAQINYFAECYCLLIISNIFLALEFVLGKYPEILCCLNLCSVTLGWQDYYTGPKVLL